MADFCTVCSIEMFGIDMKPDIDIKEWSDEIPEGHYQSCICEGCGLSAVGKNNGKPSVYFRSMLIEDYNPRNRNIHDKADRWLILEPALIDIENMNENSCWNDILIHAKEVEV